MAQRQSILYARDLQAQGTCALWFFFVGKFINSIRIFPVSCIKLPSSINHFLQVCYIKVSSTIQFSCAMIQINLFYNKSVLFNVFREIWYFADRNSLVNQTLHIIKISRFIFSLFLPSILSTLILNCEGCMCSVCLLLY